MDAKDIKVEYTSHKARVYPPYRGKIRFQLPSELEDTIWLMPCEARILSA